MKLDTKGMHYQLCYELYYAARSTLFINFLGLLQVIMRHTNMILMRNTLYALSRSWFQSLSEKQMERCQRSGIFLRESNLNTDLSSLWDAANVIGFLVFFDFSWSNMKLLNIAASAAAKNNNIELRTHVQKQTDLHITHDLFLTMRLFIGNMFTRNIMT